MLRVIILSGMEHNNEVIFENFFHKRNVLVQGVFFSVDFPLNFIQVHTKLCSITVNNIKVITRWLSATKNFDIPH